MKELFEPPPLKKEEPTPWPSLSLSLSPLDSGWGDLVPEAVSDAEDSRPSGPVRPIEKRMEEKFVESCRERVIDSEK